MNWTFKKLGEVMDIARGGSPRPIKKYLTDSEDGLNWIKISDATASNKYICETKQKITKDGLHKTRLVEEGDFLLSNSMSFGRPYIMKTKGCIHDGWLVLKEKEKDLLDKDFLYHLLGSPYIFKEFDRLAAGSTVRNLNIALVSSVQIPIPPLSEQKQIVAILDKAFVAIDQAKANIEKNIANAKELFQSKLNVIFSHPSTDSGGKANTEPAEVWEVKTLGEVCETSAGGTPLKSHKEYYENGNIPWIRSGEVNNRNIQNSEIKITHQGLDNSSAKLFPTETVVIAMYGATAGQVGILKFECSTNQAVCGIYPNEKYVPEFLYYYFIDFKEKLVAQAVGNAQPNISQKKIKDTIIPVIQIEEQIKIVEELDALNEELKQIETHYHQKLVNLEDFKKSLLQRAFSGALTSTRWISPTAKIIPLQPVTGISTTDLQAGITALALQKHIAENQQHTFHHVKAEKIIHLSEYILNIDLDRNPTKDAAGPNDFPHAKKVESRARKAGFYSVIKKEGYYDYVHRRRMDSIIEKTQNCLGEKIDLLSQIIDTLIPLKTKQAEIVATLYAAWNNLLIRKEKISDEAIVYEARENWHKSKLNIERERFFKAIEWMKKHDFLTPKGNGKLIQAKSN